MRAGKPPHAIAAAKVVEELDALKTAEVQELSTKVRDLIIRKMGHLPHPRMLNRKAKRRLESILRCGDAQRIAKAVHAKYEAKRAELC